MKQLKDLASDGVAIVVKRDSNVEMASIRVGDQHFMDGDFWDFKPECHWGFHYKLAKLHGTWMSSRGLAETIKRCLEAEGATDVTIVDETYDWMALMRSFDEQAKAAAA
jgi:hypothetical protein